MTASAVLGKAAFQAVCAMPLPMRRRFFYAVVHRRFPNVRTPERFTEKITWRILNDRREILTSTCDKLRMKDIAVERAGDLLRVPRTLWRGTDLRELDGLAVEGEWILKPNHRSQLVIAGSGQPVVADLMPRTKGWLDELNWAFHGEWAYQFADRCFILEERIGNPPEFPTNYDIYVFDGVPSLISADRRTPVLVSVNYMRPDWTPLPVRSRKTAPAADLPKPTHLEAMLEAARRIAAGFDFLRIDLYDAEGHVWFGEAAAYPMSGLGKYDPPEFDLTLGQMWTLPSLRSSG